MDPNLLTRRSLYPIMNTKFRQNLQNYQNLGWGIFRMILLILLILSKITSASGQTITTYTVTLTNAGGTTNGASITVNGAPRLWTNNVTTNATQIFTNNTPLGSTSNLYNAYLSFPVSGVTVSTNSGTNVVFTSDPGTALTVTAGGTWAAVANLNFTPTNGVVVQVPPTIYGPIDLTNIENGLVQFLSDSLGTNLIPGSAKFFANFAGLTNTNKFTQPMAIGTNALSATNQLEVTAPGHPRALVVDTNGNTYLAGNLATTNYHLAVGTNSTTNALEINAQFLPKAFFVSSNGDTFLGPTAALTLLDLAGGGEFIPTIDNNGTLGIDPGSSGMLSDGTNLALLNSPTNRWNPNGTNFFGKVDSLVTQGTNTIGGVVVLPQFNNTAMANGVNQAVVLGTNMATKLTGETAAFATAGFAGGIADRFCFVENPSVYNWTIPNDSGGDTTPANRIYTGTGADLVLSSNSWALVKYDASVTHWKVIFASGLPSSGGSGTFSGSFTGNGGGLTNVNSLTSTNYRAGFQFVGNLATSQAVAFTTPFSPAVGTNYAVTIGSDSTLASAVGFSAGSKTTNGFTINLSAGVAGGVGVDYHAVPYQ